MSLRDVITRVLPLAGSRKGGLSRGESLGLKPARNPVVTWTAAARSDDDLDEQPSGSSPESLVLIVPRRDDTFSRIVSAVFKVQGFKRIELDEFGSQVWLMCDGEHSVEQLIGMTSSRYKLNRRQAEVSVVSFMRMLSQRRLIGFISHERTSRDANRQPRTKPKRRASTARQSRHK